ncbi:Crp/Fnr family transcriptional regulator [Mucilaginibacter ximonensis]|uniref:Crp/Fnr family transcriptional regulator n=1 Tax=Mucilaginibacter ximonensis TaxID=538021 RepID=A0ABW5Y9U8_9SPHI
MFEHLKTKFPELTDHWERYAHVYKREEVPARTILLREGEVSKRSFFIETGCLRAWINNQGKDTTFQFFFEHEVISSAESFRKNIPSMCTIETVEPSVINVLTKKDYELIMADLKTQPELLSNMLDITFERQLHYMREFLSFIRDTPQERYLNLLREKPQIVQRVPQHYIASYLGITTVHLSRIKNKILKEKR